MSEPKEVIGTSAIMELAMETICEAGRLVATELTSETASERTELTTDTTEAAGTSLATAVASEIIESASVIMLETGRSETSD